MDDLLTIDEAAQRLRLSRSTIERMIDRGVLQVLRIFTNGRATKRPAVRVPASALSRVVQGDGFEKPRPTAEQLERDAQLAGQVAGATGQFVRKRGRFWWAFRAGRDSSEKLPVTSRLDSH